MAKIIMADDGIVFDSSSLESGPLGGAETAFLSLAQAFAKRRHQVEIWNKCPAPKTENGVNWQPLSDQMPNNCDLYIANRSDKLIRKSKDAENAAFWIHNPANYLLKPRYLWKLWNRKMPIIFSGNYHAKSYPMWAPDCGRHIIPYGISDDFRLAVPVGIVPRPHAIFTSNPLRGLDWLLNLWRDKIFPVVSTAELHIYSGPATYGSYGAYREAIMNKILQNAQGMQNKGVFLHEPVSKRELANVLLKTRALLYRGDPGETFCLSVGEAQAVGVPAVVKDIGCVSERIIDNETGFLAHNDDAFVEKTIKLLTDDKIWQKLSSASLAQQRSWGWENAAEAFEELFL